ncbi:MAG: thiamine pyrophosphate-dependent dehydrogenase E1 component subunit alpha [candidate division Zixibacteria bacterium]|nr:thiamine pyrophosphate-dependent dehydrogenase E1 component subunit alpha [candidate division Zixibacteria bacterium]
MDTDQSKNKVSLKEVGLSADVLMGLYTCLLKTRQLDEKLRRLFRQGRFAGTYFSAVGQEATTVGSAYGLRDDDIIGPSHREIGAMVAKGVPLSVIVAQVYARSSSPDKGKSHPCHYGYRPKGIINPSSTVAGQTVVATGCAMAFKIQKKDNIALAYFGEGATARGGWHEALNFAGIHKLPIVYICENNLWAESVPASLEAGIEHFADRSKAYGFQGITIDGNDLVVVHKAASEAIAKARSGGGPTLIECLTYRWYGHSEIDPANYRRSEELEEWKKKDPILGTEKLLTKLGLLATGKREALVEQVNQEIEEAVKTAEATKYAEPEEAYNDVYSDKFPVRRDELGMGGKQ